MARKLVFFNELPFIRIIPSVASVDRTRSLCVPAIQDNGFNKAYRRSVLAGAMLPTWGARQPQD